MYKTGIKSDKKLSLEENGFELWQIGQENSHSFTNLAIKCYMMNRWITQKDVEKMYLEDVHYSGHGIFFALKHWSSPYILATFRLVRKECDISFPFQDYFGINLDELCREIHIHPTEIWHGGRIAVDKGKLESLGFEKNYSVKLVEILLHHVYRVVTRNRDNLFIGENYLLMQRFYVMNLGLKMTVVKKKEYFPGVVGCASYITAEELIQNFADRVEKTEKIRKTAVLL